MIPTLKKEVKVEVKQEMNPNHYWSARDVCAGLILPSHLYGKLKSKYAQKV